MAKITSNNVSSGYSVTINDNFQKIDTELNTKVLYRSNPFGEPNQMLNALDMDSNDILNVGSADFTSLSIAGTNITSADAAVSTLPTQTGNDGKVLRTNGSTASWEDMPIDVYATVALMKVDNALAPGDLIRTVGYTTAGAGQGLYLVKTAVQAATDGDVIDEIGAGFTLANGNVAVLQVGQLVDLNLWGITGTAGDVAKSQACFDYVKGTGKKVIGIGSIYLDNDLYLYNDADLSGITLLVNGGALNVADDRADADCRKTLTGAEIDTSVLTELKASLKTAIVDPQVLVDFANSYVSISSDDTYINRYESGVWTAMTKFAVAVMGKYGRLTYTLPYEFIGDTNVTINLYKLHPKRLTLTAPQIQVVTVNRYAALKVTRNNTTVNAFSVRQDFSGVTYNLLYSSLFTVSDCAGLRVNGFDTDGYGVTNNESGVASETRYDFIYGNSVDVVVQGVNCQTGWKSFDGNRSRGITIRDGMIDSLNGHFGCADFTIDNIINRGRAYAFGTGARDSKIVFKKCTFEDGDPSCISVRADYGELRGDLIVTDCVVNKRDTNTSSGLYLVDLNENAIKLSGGAEPAQPDILYEYPRRIIAENITVRCLNDFSPIRFDAHTFTATQKLKMPREVKFRNFNVEEVGGFSFLEYRAVPYDYLTMDNIIFELTNWVSADEDPIDIRMGNIGLTSYQETYSFDLQVNNCTIASGFHRNAQIAGDKDSKVRITNSIIYDELDMYEGGFEHRGSLEIEGCLFDIATATTNFTLGGTYMSVSHSVVDGSKYLAAVASTPNFQALVHNADNNIGIDVTSTFTTTPASGTYQSTGKQTVMNKPTEVGNFTKNLTTNVLTKTW